MTLGEFYFFLYHSLKTQKLFVCNFFKYTKSHKSISLIVPGPTGGAAKQANHIPNAPKMNTKNR